MKVQLKKLTLSIPASGFVVVSSPTLRLRTQLFALAEEPTLTHSLLSFPDVGPLKIALFHGKSVESGNVVGNATLRVGEEQLREKGAIKRIEIKNKDKIVGVLVMRVDLIQQHRQQSILYTAEQKDPLMINKYIEKLQKEAGKLFAEWKDAHTEQDQLQRVLSILQIEQQTLKQMIQEKERQNNRMQKIFSMQEDREQLKIQIQFLRQSPQGVRVLQSKLQQMRARVEKQKQVRQKRQKEYDRVRRVIQEMAERKKQLAERIRGKQAQQFEIEKNKQVLERRQAIEEQFLNNEEAIAHLLKLSKQSQYTAQQAALFLSQVNYKLKLEETAQQKSEANDDMQEIDSLQEQTMKFKLQAILHQVERVKNKMRAFQ